MDWEYVICLYTETHCASRGLRSLTISAYDKTLRQFRDYVQVIHGDPAPQEVNGRIVMDYIAHLRDARDNGDSAVNRAVTVLKNFYRALVAMGHMLPRENPLADFPTMKGVARKLPVVLSDDEVAQLLESPPTDIVLGLRDRALLTLIYGTGIRASECANLREGDVNLGERTIRVIGKGGHERVIPLNDKVVEVLSTYRTARGALTAHNAFFRSRMKKALSRGAVHERVRKYALLAKIPKRVSPHTLRHTFATHLLKANVNLVTIRDLLGHRQITSTQIYLHVTADDLRAAIVCHPVARLAPLTAHLMPHLRLPFQHAPPRRRR